jgi:hypothetical protein
MVQPNFPKVAYGSEESVTYPLRFFEREIGTMEITVVSIKYASKKNIVEIDKSKIEMISHLNLGDILDLKMFMIFFIVLIFLADALFMWINLFFFPGHKIFIFIAQTIILSCGMFFLIFLHKSRWVLVEYYGGDDLLLRKAYFSVPGWEGVNGGTQKIFESIKS